LPSARRQLQSSSKNQCTSGMESER
jgi:hypothetical protein